MADFARAHALVTWSLGAVAVATLFSVAAVSWLRIGPGPAPARDAMSSQATTRPAAIADVQNAPPLPSSGTSSEPTLSATPESAPTARVVIPVEGWGLVIRRIGVNARISEMGVTSSGQMEVPQNARGVAWYRFTAIPGSAGNAVLAGHVDWAGETGVFGSLRALARGDVVDVVSPMGTLTYRVASVALIRPEDADMNEIVGQRSGHETLTLITCGGDWNRATHDYNRRVVVRAERVAPPQG